MICPNCKEKNAGKIGPRRYYCNDCFYEFEVKENQFVLFILMEDGKMRKVRTIEMNRVVARLQG